MRQAWRAQQPVAPERVVARLRVKFLRLELLQLKLLRLELEPLAAPGWERSPSGSVRQREQRGEVQVAWAALRAVPAAGALRRPDRHHWQREAEGRTWADAPEWL
ncbi:hypothetical protein BH20VER1_BH20VER1_12890 [soil metagenome]